MTKTQNDQRQSVSVEIACDDPDAQAVYVAGDFNGWDPTATAMKRSADGRWTTHLALSPGRHEYKFVIDGRWCCEPGCHVVVGCPKCTPNAFGTMNRFVDVG